MRNEPLAILDEIKQKSELYAAKLAGVRIIWSNRLKVSAGQAHYAAKTIKLSLPIFSMEENKHGLRNTVLHEIAHLLAGPGVGHSRQWRMIARSIGCNGERCHTYKVIDRPGRRATTKMVACIGCNAELGYVGAQRLAKLERYRCPRCKSHLRIVD